MPRRPSRSHPTQRPVEFTTETLRQGIERLTKRLDAVEKFEPTSVTEQTNIAHVDALAASIDDALIRTFGADTLDYKRYSDAAFFDNGPFNCVHETPIGQVHKSLARSKATSIALLKEAISSLEERMAEFIGLPSLAVTKKPASFARKVFVVHGHDNEAKETVAGYLRRLGFEAIILHEQANRGRTVIEKVEDHGDVGFAVVILTPDDEGAKKGQPPQSRARQNVVLELGYFLARLGRDRVCPLRRGDVEIPSDFDGVVYTEFDAYGGWKSKLAQELSAAGYDIDWQKVHT